ncbi:hypothetical protein PG995_006024 [Apiospora arundinis]
MTAAAALLLQFPSTATAAPLAAEGGRAEPRSLPFSNRGHKFPSPSLGAVPVPAVVHYSSRGHQLPFPSYYSSSFSSLGVGVVPAILVRSRAHHNEHGRGPLRRLPQALHLRRAPKRMRAGRADPGLPLAHGDDIVHPHRRPAADVRVPVVHAGVVVVDGDG